MKLNTMYKHINNTDVAIIPHEVQFIMGEGYNIKVSWYNIVNPKNVYPCGLTETIFIKSEDIKNWKEYK